MILFKVDRTDDSLDQQLLNKYGVAPKDTLKQLEITLGNPESVASPGRPWWHLGLANFFTKYQN